MIRNKIGKDAQKVLFGITIEEAFEQSTCVRCHNHVVVQNNIDFEWNSLCNDCRFQLADTKFQPVPIEVSIQTGEHVGDCIAVRPEWDGFTCLNGLVKKRISHDDLQRLCMTAENENMVIKLIAQADPNHTIYLLPTVRNNDRKGVESSVVSMLRLLSEVCSKDSSFKSLLITHFSHTNDPNMSQLLGMCKAIHHWNDWKDFGSLKTIFFGVHPSTAVRLSEYLSDMFDDAFLSSVER